MKIKKQKRSKLDPFADRLIKLFTAGGTLAEAKEQLSLGGCSVSLSVLSAWWEKHQWRRLQERLPVQVESRQRAASYKPRIMLPAKYWHEVFTTYEAAIASGIDAQAAMVAVCEGVPHIFRGIKKDSVRSLFYKKHKVWTQLGRCAESFIRRRSRKATCRQPLTPELSQVLFAIKEEQNKSTAS